MQGEDLSEEFLHWAAKQRDGLPEGAAGTTLEAAIAALREAGQPLEDVWPYDSERDDQSAEYLPQTGAEDAAKERIIRGATRLASRAETLLQVLEGGRAVLLVVRLHVTWYYPSSEGVIGMPTTTQSSLGNHAVLVVGYYEGDESGMEPRFIVRNSWGDDWGRDGYGYLQFGYVDDYGLAASYLEI